MVNGITTYLVLPNLDEIYFKTWIVIQYEFTTNLNNFLKIEFPKQHNMLY